MTSIDYFSHRCFSVDRGRWMWTIACKSTFDYWRSPWSFEKLCCVVQEVSVVGNLGDRPRPRYLRCDFDFGAISIFGGFALHCKKGKSIVGICLF